MNNDLENLISKVGTPVGRIRFKFLRVFNFHVREFRIKFLKISSAIFVAVIVMLFLAGRGGSQALKISSVDGVKSNNETVNKVAKLIVLPEENPVIAIIAKVELLKNNIFFNGAKNGDKVLLFEKSGKAILYSSELNKIINIGTIDEAAVHYK